MNKDFWDAMQLVSFMVGLANYDENMTQSDKQEIMDKLDKQTADILQDIKAELREIKELIEDAKSEDKH